jgi:hypothetical protein
MAALDRSSRMAEATSASLQRPMLGSGEVRLREMKPPCGWAPTRKRAKKIKRQTLIFHRHKGDSQ